MSTQAAETPGPAIPEDTIANRLMLARGRIPIRRAALLCGLNRGTWQNWEHGLYEPRLSDLRKIAVGLNRPLHWLAEGGPLADPKPLGGDSPGTSIGSATDGYLADSASVNDDLMVPVAA